MNHHNDIDIDDENKNDEDQIMHALDTRIIDIIRKKKPNFKIRPAELASELGISIDDASAELCGLLRAVGPTAIFQFESISTSLHATPNHANATNSSNSSNNNNSKKVTVMTFTFPPDFDKKALVTKRKEDIHAILWNIIHAIINILKVIVAFGLIISLCVVCIGGICIMIAGIVALSRGGGGGGGQQHQHHRRLMGYTRRMWFSIRQFLWIFYLCSNSSNNNSNTHDHSQRFVDPFMMDVISTLAFWNPRSLWFWFRIHRMRNRRARMNQGWGRESIHTAGGTPSSSSISAGTWNERNNTTNNDNHHRLRHHHATTNSNSDRDHDHDQRGILSIAVEFLFGPTPFHPGPTDFEKWKLREQFILQLTDKQSNGNGNGCIDLIQFLPFVDSPPPLPTISSMMEENDDDDDDNNNEGTELQLENNTQMRSECLKIISHFNGVPYIRSRQQLSVLDSSTTTTTSASTSPFKASFVFPELTLSETSYTTSAYSMATMASTLQNNDTHNCNDSFLYLKDKDKDNPTLSTTASSGYILGRTMEQPSQLENNQSTTTITSNINNPIASFLHENRHVLTKLTQSHFQRCIMINMINYIGLLILWKAIHQDGVLEIKDLTSFKYQLIKCVLLVLDFYAKLFFVLPIGRALILLVLNHCIDERNKRREVFATFFSVSS